MQQLECTERERERIPFDFSQAILYRQQDRQSNNNCGNRYSVNCKNHQSQRNIELSRKKVIYNLNKILTIQQTNKNRQDTGPVRGGRRIVGEAVEIDKLGNFRRKARIFENYKIRTIEDYHSVVTLIKTLHRN